MLRLKLKEGFGQVFVGLNVENPLTGKSITVDAKIDTGAEVTLIPMQVVSDMGLEVIGETELMAANGSGIHAFIANVILSLAGMDSFELPVYIGKMNAGIALIGMDVLSQCNYSQQHEWSNGEHYINFEIELAEMPE